MSPTVCGSGVTDSSGMRIYLTNRSRPIESGAMAIYTHVNIHPIVPPLTKRYGNYVYCPTECTAGVAPGGFNFHSYTLHTHLTGKLLGSFGATSTNTLS